jgi:hypothetical protein
MYIDFPRIYGVDECSFYGVYKSGQKEYGCGRIWSQYKREQLWDAVERAKQKIELHMGIALGRKVVCEEQHPYNYKTSIVGPLDWKSVLAVGVEVETTVAAAAALTLRTDGVINDPVVLTVATTATDPCELYLFHTDAKGGGQIDPSVRSVRGKGLVTDITIAGGNATIKIPRCHLTDPDMPQPENGYVYETDSNFVTTIVVKRRYIDTTQGVVLLTKPNAYDCTPACVISETAACAVPQNAKTGMLVIQPTVCYSHSMPPYAVKVSYVAGYNDPCSAMCEQIPLSLQHAVVRLAHTEMPQGPCGCTIHDESWQKDRERVQSFLAWEDLRNPFGTLEGQVYAWKTLRLFMEGEGGVF